MTKKSERIIETKETEQKRQAQIERGRCDKKIKGLRQNERGKKKDLWILE